MLEVFLPFVHGSRKSEVSKGMYRSIYVFVPKILSLHPKTSDAIAVQPICKYTRIASSQHSL